LLRLGNTRHAPEIGIAAPALKRIIPGDINDATEAEVLGLMPGGGSGCVERSNA